MEDTVQLKMHKKDDDSNKAKIAIVAMCKNENKYIREWVEYHKSIGINRIFIIDNNDLDGDVLDDVIGDYITNRFVIVINMRGIKTYHNYGFLQFSTYSNIFDKYKDKFDWICYIDCDEFIHVENKEFISNVMPKYNEYDIVHLNVEEYGDNELITVQDNNFSVSRFKTPIPYEDITVNYGNKKYFHNCHVKTFINTKVNERLVFKNTHTVNNILKCCDENLKQQPSYVPLSDMYSFNNIWIKHYSTKTLEEYITFKINRGYPDIDITPDLHNFFTKNKITKEKLEYVKQRGLKIPENISRIIQDN